MDSDDPHTNMDVTNNSEQSHIKHCDTPGGEKATLPEEPKLSEESTNSDMGCASARPDDSSHNENDHSKKTKTNQENTKTKVTNTQAMNQNETKSKTNNASADREMSVSGDNMSEDEDDQNDSVNRTTGRVTRSSVALAKITLKFEDSDDDSSSPYYSWSKRDIMEYRNNYPNASQDKNIKDNYKFFTNKIASHPEGDFIDNIHKNWWGNYHRLEVHHGYIQWLFPLQERGLNWSAEALQKHEIQLIKEDEKARKRLLKSYELMLDFYGFELVNKETGKIRRSSDGSWQARFRNLNFSSHNYLRITRILKCLGEFDYEYLKFPFLEKILFESIIQNTLPNCLRSCKDYWIETLRDQKERRNIRRYARELIDYRHKGIRPPKEHRAERPQSTATPANNRVSSSKLSTRSSEDLH